MSRISLFRELSRRIEKVTSREDIDFEELYKHPWTNREFTGGSFGPREERSKEDSDGPNAGQDLHDTQGSQARVFSQASVPLTPEGNIRRTDRGSQGAVAGLCQGPAVGAFQSPTSRACSQQVPETPEPPPPPLLRTQVSSPRKRKRVVGVVPNVLQINQADAVDVDVVRHLELSGVAPGLHTSIKSIQRQGAPNQGPNEKRNKTDVRVELASAYIAEKESDVNDSKTNSPVEAHHSVAV